MNILWVNWRNLWGDRSSWVCMKTASPQIHWSIIISYHFAYNKNIWEYCILNFQSQPYIMWKFPESWGYPQLSSIYRLIFHCKPSILVTSIYHIKLVKHIPLRISPVLDDFPIGNAPSITPKWAVFKTPVDWWLQWIILTNILGTIIIHEWGIPFLDIQ